SSDLKGSQQDLKQDVQELKGSQQDMRQDVQELKGSQQDMKQDFQELKGSQQDLKQDLHGLKDNQQKMKQEFSSRFDTIEQKLDGVQKQVAKNAEHIVVMRDNIGRMKVIQERQEKTIDLLSRRSIDQEAEIKQIK